MSDKQTLYFAVYVNVDGASAYKGKEIIKTVMEILKKDDPDAQYKEKWVVLPVKGQPTKIELLYPHPFLTDEQAEDLYQKYYQKYEDVLTRVG